MEKAKPACRGDWNHRLTGPDTGKVTGRRKPALTSHRTSQGRQRRPRKENATPAEANPGQAIAQNRPEAMQVCLGLTAMSAPFAFGAASPAKASLAHPTTNVRFPAYYVKSGQSASDPKADIVGE